MVVPPKSFIFMGISIINHPFWRIPIFGNTHIRNNLKESGHNKKHLYWNSWQFYLWCHIWYGNGKPFGGTLPLHTNRAQFLIMGNGPLSQKFIWKPFRSSAELRPIVLFLGERNVENTRKKNTAGLKTSKKWGVRFHWWGFGLLKNPMKIAFESNYFTRLQALWSPKVGALQMPKHAWLIWKLGPSTSARPPSTWSYIISLSTFVSTGGLHP